MLTFARATGFFVAGGAVATLLGFPLSAQSGREPAPSGTSPVRNLMANPYRLVEDFPRLGTIKPGTAMGILPDGKGGLWLFHRSEPPIVHLDASGNVIAGFGNGMFLVPHGFCRDRDGNFWAGDSGPFADTQIVPGRGFVFHKFSPDGKLLLTIGKQGVSKAGPDTFVAPTACVIMANGDLLIADGHVTRASNTQPDGDRLVQFTTSGKFVREWGRRGTGPGEFVGPHALAFDSQGRLFVADRSNQRIQIFDKAMNYLDEWRHFSRPSGLVILEDDTLIVSDSESEAGFWPFEMGPVKPGERAGQRNAGWKTGIRVGSAKDGSLKYFIPNTRPEGLGADGLGNIYAGPNGGCPAPGGCLQKFALQNANER